MLDNKIEPKREQILDARKKQKVLEKELKESNPEHEVIGYTAFDKSNKLIYCVAVVLLEDSGLVITKQTMINHIETLIDNDIAAIVQAYKDRVYIVHIIYID